MVYKKILKIFLYILVSLIMISLILGVIAYFSDNVKLTLPVKHKEVFKHTQLTNFPPLLHVEGYKIVESSGDTITLKRFNANRSS